MSERIKISPIPKVILDPSIQDLPYLVEPNPRGFARLARAVGVPELEIGNLSIILVKGFLDGERERGHLSWSVDVAKRKLRLAILGREDADLAKLVETAAHEFDHYRIDLGSRMDPSTLRRGRQNDDLELNRMTLKPDQEEYFATYYFTAMEIHARETARTIARSRKRYNLVRYRDKREEFRGIWPFRKRRA